MTVDFSNLLLCVVAYALPVLSPLRLVLGDSTNCSGLEDFFPFAPLVFKKGHFNAVRERLYKGVHACTSKMLLDKAIERSGNRTITCFVVVLAHLQQFNVGVLDTTSLKR